MSALPKWDDTNKDVYFLSAGGYHCSVVVVRFNGEVDYYNATITGKDFNASRMFHVTGFDGEDGALDAAMRWCEDWVGIAPVDAFDYPAFYAEWQRICRRAEQVAAIILSLPELADAYDSGRFDVEFESQDDGVWVGVWELRDWKRVSGSDKPDFQYNVPVRFLSMSDDDIRSEVADETKTWELKHKLVALKYRRDDLDVHRQQIQKYTDMMQKAEADIQQLEAEIEELDRDAIQQ